MMYKAVVTSDNAVNRNYMSENYVLPSTLEFCNDLIIRRQYTDRYLKNFIRFMFHKRTV